MECKPWTRRLNRLLPKRFRDQLPQPLPHLLPSSLHQPNAPTHTDPSLLSPAQNISAPSPHGASLRNRILQVFTTSMNHFGLFRRYEATQVPSYDPEENDSLEDLSDIPRSCPPSTSKPSNTSFYPYPNGSSFRLGDWYWSEGAQKSQSSFKRLVNIVTDPDFSPADVRKAHWDQINQSLGSDDTNEWVDDASWTNSPITITIPFQPHRGKGADWSPGPKDFTMPEFRHRNLVSVIREKLTQPAGMAHFHYEPYELHWQSLDGTRQARVYGEAYTSLAFIDAHRELQASPLEPNCDLPHVVVALMFWSDVTQLTSFGNADLWPLYLFFGNESKYRRAKPSNHLCHHIAYFQKVCFTFFCSSADTIFLIAPCELQRFCCSTDSWW
jgi:hypothetical protein